MSNKIDDLTKGQQEQKRGMKKLLEQITWINATLEEEANKGKTSQNWTTILRRFDGSVDFYRGWNEYRQGFGNPPNGEFFIGLEKLHELTTAAANIELKIILRDWQGEERYAIYSAFQIADQSEKYKIKKLGEYSGTAGDSLSYNRGLKFSTFDADNDNSRGNCAEALMGAWWFSDCSASHFFGAYNTKRESETGGIVWFHWKYSSRYSFKYAEMLIKATLV
ncbi:ficolin-1-like [Musca vetustissima]|uniref:ficolin-1-like n=1 Tax=Musca vetustissima TaxID=27455 RepID=UPI002AB6EC6C|nr:ficolin-1-like [Musca vetustissima]